MKSLFEVLLIRLSQGGLVLIFPFVHAYQFASEFFVTWSTMSSSSLFDWWNLLCHLICFPILKVKLLKLDKLSFFLCFTGMFILDIYFFKYCHWVNGFPYLMISIFFLSYLRPSCLWVLDKGFLTTLCPTLFPQLNVHFTSHITLRIHWPH